MLHKWALSFCFAFSVVATQTIMSPGVGAQTVASTISGTLIDITGLPIAGASVDLHTGSGIKVATATSGPAGTFQFQNEPAGVYYAIVRASGYKPTQSDDIIATDGAVSRVRIGLAKASAGENTQTIGRVSSNLTGANVLQSSATITESVDPKVLQQEGSITALAGLQNLPGITTNADSSRGNDGTLQIRGSKNTEVAVLLDGHPIGPQGVQSDGGVNDPWDNGFNFMSATLFGLNNVQVTYGSGAVGLFGTATLGGAVDLQTLNPTLKPTFTFRQGLGNQAQSLTEFDASGTIGGKLGYVLLHGVQGTVGQITPGVLFHAGCVSNNITSAYLQSYLCTYAGSQNFLVHNDLAKIAYNFSPSTSLTFSAYDSVAWQDSTGNGDNKFFSYDYKLYKLNNAYATHTDTGCTAAAPVAFTTNSGSQCFATTQAATYQTGLSNDGATRQRGNRLNDFNLKFRATAGINNIAINVFQNQYTYLKDSHGATQAPNGEDIGALYQAKYNGTGALISDDISTPRNDVGFGVSTTYNIASGSQYVPATPATPTTPAMPEGFYPLGIYPFGSNDAFVRDEFRPTDKLAIDADLNYKHSTTQQSNSLDPRVSLIYRGTPHDIARVTFGQAVGLPSPLLTSFPFTFGAKGPGSTNYVCNGLTILGSSPNPNVQKESGNDSEVAIAHRFKDDSTIQIDGYYNNEQNVIFAGSLPLTAFSNIAVNPNSLAAYNTAWSAACPGQTPSYGVYGLSTYFNAASGISKGFDLSGRVRLSPNVYADYVYGVNSTYRNGISIPLLQANKTFINGAQLPGIPLQQGSIAFGYDHSRAGISARVESTYLSQNNSFDRGGMFYSNGFVKKAFKNVDLTFGVTNIFNQYVIVYNEVGYGLFVPENAFGTDRNSFDQGTQLRGLDARSFLMTASIHF